MTLPSSQIMSGEVRPDIIGSKTGDTELKTVSEATDSDMATSVYPSYNGSGQESNGTNVQNPVSLRVISAELPYDSHATSATVEDDPDGINLTPESLGPLLATNQYTVRKMAAQGLMDVALMMANISQLRTLISSGPDVEHYYILLGLVSISLAAQVLFAIIIFVIWMRETEDNYREEFLATIRQVAANKRPESIAAKETLTLNRAKQEEKFRRHEITNRLNYGTIVLVFITTVINMFITGFGIKLENPAFQSVELLNQSDAPGS